MGETCLPPPLVFSSVVQLKSHNRLIQLSAFCREMTSGLVVVKSSLDGRWQHGVSVLLDRQLETHCPLLGSVSLWVQGKSFVLIITKEGLLGQRAFVP